jgi:hypothetical protein
MGALVVYILEWSVCLLGFLFLYKMCFSGSTFHRFNRLYLLGIVVLSAMLPLIHITPTQQMEPVAETCRVVMPVDENVLDGISVTSGLEAASEGLTLMEKGAMILLAIYLIYVLVQLAGWTKSIAKMLWFLHGKRRRRIGRWVKLVEHDAEYGPFSWMNYIVISSHEEGFGRRASMRHELSHIVLLHHLDLLLLMVCVIINPVCWLVMQEIKVVHEYEADDEVIGHYRIQSRDYQRLLIMRTVGAEAYALASSFNLNIKKRIMMMKKKQSRGWRIMWIAVTLPLIGVSLMAFSKPKEALKVAVDNSVKAVEQPLAELTTAVLDGPAAETAEPQKPEKAEEPQQTASEVKAGSTITGTVTDKDGPLHYANLVEIDQYGRIVAQATTDKNGHYALKVVNPAHKIRISYVGYKNNTLDIGSNKMDAMLEPMTGFSNVTVVGRRDSIDLNSPRYKDQTNDDKDDKTFSLVEQMPTFPGGTGEIMKYLSLKLLYPSVAREMRVEGEIVVRFTVDKTGLVRSPQVVEVNAKSPLITAEVAKAAKEGDEEAEETSKNYLDAIESMKEEAIHVVRNMPRWEPGRQNGKRISTTYTLPIVFKMQ